MTTETLTASVTTECICHEEDGIDEVCFGDCYEMQKEDVSYLISKWQELHSITEDDTILVIGKGMGWQSLSGWKETNILKLDGALALDGDFRIEWSLEENHLTARRWSHDEPTGSATFEFVVNPSEEEA